MLQKTNPNFLSVVKKRNVSMYSSTDVHASYDDVNRASVEALLHLVSRANALVAALLKTSSNYPAAFRPSSSNKYTPLLMDLSYLKSADAHERAIEGSRELLALDAEFQETYKGVLEETYAVFEGIVIYHSDLTHLIRQLQEGAMFMSSLETLLLGHEGKQLMIEAVYLYGALMLILDKKMPGPLRERVIVAYYRYKGGAQAVGRSINAVITLCKNSGYAPDNTRLPAGYPEKYFASLPLPSEVVMMLVNSIKSDDVYNQIGHYPNPEHRSIALGQQAGYLYVLLFFVPHVLHKDAALMRMLVDKHFSDNWMVAWGPGFIADLAVDWDNYKAAKAALASVISVTRARQTAAAFAAQLPAFQEQLDSFLVEGMLKEEFLLQRADIVFNCLRNCNVTARWLLLHLATKNRKLRDAVHMGAPPVTSLLRLLLDTALLEFEVKRLYSALLETKEQRWREYREQVIKGLRELSEFYSGSQVLSRNLQDDNLAAWFAAMGDRVAALDYRDPVGDSREIRRLVAALQEVGSYHRVDASLQAKQYLEDIRAQLSKMVSTGNVREELMSTLVVVSDFSYAWELIEEYVPKLQAFILHDPKAVFKVRCFFLKLRSVLELPLLRISQSNSPHMYNVTHLYSTELLSFVRRVLQVVPTCVFEVLENMVQLQASSLREVPTRVPKEQVKEYAQLSERAELATLTHRAAAFAQGILAMESTFLGVIELDPRKLLQDGIRQKLRGYISSTCDALLTFNTSGQLLTFSHYPMTPTPLAFMPIFNTSTSATGEVIGFGMFPARMAVLADKLGNMQRAFEYVQDFVNMNATRMWQQEATQVIRAALSAELPRLRNTALDSSDNISDAVLQMEHEGLPVTFLGRVAAELLRLSDPVRTVHSPVDGCWRDGAGNTLLGLHSLRLVNNALGVQCLTGLDQLLGYRARQALLWLFEECKRGESEGAGWRGVVTEFENACNPQTSCPESGLDAYTDATMKMGGFGLNMSHVIGCIGQAVLLRQLLAAQTEMHSRLKAPPVLLETVSSLNEAIMAARENNQQDGAGSSGTRDEVSLWVDTAEMLEATGLYRPECQLYCAPPDVPHFSTLLFLVLLCCVGRYTYSNGNGAGGGGGIERKSPRGTVDAEVMMTGLGVLLRHCTQSVTQGVLSYIGQCVRAHLTAASTATSRVGVQGGGIQLALPQHAALLIYFAEGMCRTAGIERVTVQQYISPYLLDTWKVTLCPAV